MQFWEDRESGWVIVRLQHGDLVLESLCEVAKAADIHTGVLATGIGSLSKARIHVIATNNYPPGDIMLEIDGPLEVVQFGGIIANHQPHIHISLWDSEKRYHGGHLEPGCVVLTLSEISIQRVPGLRMTRRDLDGTGVQLLDAE